MTQRRVMLAAGRRAFDPAAIALFAAMTTQPDAARKTLISDTIVALKAAGIWQELDALWFMAAHHEQAGLLNWKAPASFTLTLVNGMPFEVDRGIGPGNGTNQYANTNWIPSTHGVNYTLNDASFGVYSRTNVEQNGYEMGANSGSLSRISNLAVRWGDGSRYDRVNQSSSGAITTSAPLDSAGFFTVRRSASNAQQSFRNALQVSSNATNSTSITERALYIAALNNNGTFGSPSTRQYALAYTGGALSEAQHGEFYTIIQAYMAAVGAAV